MISTRVLSQFYETGMKVVAIKLTATTLPMSWLLNANKLCGGVSLLPMLTPAKY